MNPFFQMLFGQDQQQQPSQQDFLRMLMMKIFGQGIFGPQQGQPGGQPGGGQPSLIGSNPLASRLFNLSGGQPQPSNPMPSPTGGGLPSPTQVGGVARPSPMQSINGLLNRS